jgi:hypothetical protein
MVLGICSIFLLLLLPIVFSGLGVVGLVGGALIIASLGA